MPGPVYLQRLLLTPSACSPAQVFDATSCSGCRLVLDLPVKGSTSTTPHDNCCAALRPPHLTRTGAHSPRGHSQAAQRAARQCLGCRPQYHVLGATQALARGALALGARRARSGRHPSSAAASKVRGMSALQCHHHDGEAAVSTAQGRGAASARLGLSLPCLRCAARAWPWQSFCNLMHTCVGTTAPCCRAPFRAPCRCRACTQVCPQPPPSRAW